MHALNKWIENNLVLAYTFCRRLTLGINAELDFTKTKVEILQLREKIMAPVVHHA